MKEQGDKLNQLMEENKTLNDNAKVVKEQLAAVEEKYNKARNEEEKQRQGLMEECSAMAKKAEELEIKLSQDATEQSKFFEEKLTALKSDSARKEDEFNLEKEKLTKELKDSENRFTNLDNQLQSLAAELKQKVEELTQNKTQFVTVESAMKEKDDEINTLKKSVDELQNKLQNEVTAKAATESQVVNDYQAKEMFLQKELQSLQLLLKEQDAQILQFEKSKQEMSSESEMLQESLAIQSRKLFELEKNGQKKESHLLTEIETLKMEVEELRAANKTINNNQVTKPSNQDESIDDTSAQINFLNSIIADMQMKNQKLMVRVQDLESTPKETPL